MSSVATDPRPADAKSGEELAAAAAHGLGWAAIARPATEAIQLCAVVVLARLIVPAEFGRAAIALIAQEAAYLLIAGGLSGALVQRKVLTREHLQTGVALALLAGFTFTVLTLVVAGLIVVPVFGGRTAMFVRLMAPLCLVSAMAAVPAASLQRSMAFRRLSAIEVIGTFVRAVACVGLALAGLEGEALVLGVLAGAVTVGLIMWFSSPPPLPRLPPPCGARAAQLRPPRVPGNRQLGRVQQRRLRNHRCPSGGTHRPAYISGPTRSPSNTRARSRW